MSNKYEILKKIGSGSFGDVYIGKDKKTGIKYAFKRCKKALLYQYGLYLINAFWKEVDCMEKCNCENSVKIIESFETTDYLNIIMELCDTDLLNHFQKLKRGMTTAEVRDLFKQLNNVFKIMQKNNIVHRDLKLANILIKYVDEKKEKIIPKLSDYGFSKALNENATETHLGTPVTMAPEIMLDQPYNEKVDLWSIGVMMYQLHFKELPFQGGNEKQILLRIMSKTARKHPENPQFKDLLNKLLEPDPKKRISWEDYFNHPFFEPKKEEKKNGERYTKIKNIDFGLQNFNNQFEFYLAKDTTTNKNVLIKSYKQELLKNREYLIGEEIALFNQFSGNKCILNLINFENNNGVYLFVFEYKDFESLLSYKDKKPLKEKDLNKITRELLNEVFIFSECYDIPFHFISIYSFGMDKQGKPIIIDFGLHELLLSDEEYKSYFINGEEKSEKLLDIVKRNVMNYGILLLKLLFGNGTYIKDKELFLPDGKIISPQLNKFISKCIKRNLSQRYTWTKLAEEDFVLNTGSQLSLLSKEALINEDKLNKIMRSLQEKFGMLYNFYKSILNDANFLKKNVNQIESFLLLNIMEIKIIYKFFNRNELSQPFSSKHEISFLSVNEDCSTIKFSLNFLNPLFYELKLIDLSGNKNVKTFVKNIKTIMENLDKVENKINKISKNQNIKVANYKNFLMNSLQQFENCELLKLYLELKQKADITGKKEEKLNLLYICQYLCEFMLIIKSFIYEKEEKIVFNKDNLVKKFLSLFGENTNSIEISVIQLNKPKKNYVLLSFLPKIFKDYKLDLTKNGQNNDKIMSYNGVLRSYPQLINTILDTKNNK